MKKLVFSIAMAMLCIYASAQTPSYVPTSGLVAWYPFKGDATDKSGNAIDGVVTNATLTNDRFGNCNSAYNFNGTNAYIASSSTALDNLNHFTLSFWFQITTHSAEAFLVVKGQEPTLGSSLSYRVYIGNPPSFIGTDNWLPSRTALSVPFSSASWHHLVLTYDGNEQAVYIDGVLENSTSQTGTIRTNTDSLYFGTRSYGGTLSPWFDGNLDDIGVWDRALTLTEISDLYNGEGPIPPYMSQTGLVAWYPFKGDATDQSGNAIDGVVRNATLTTDRFGNCNSAYSFNGTNAYIAANSTLLDNTNHFTLSFWFQILTHSAGAYLVVKGREPFLGASLSYRVYIGNSPAYIGADNWLPTRNAQSVLFSDPAWHHFILTYDGSDQTIYIDGTLAGSVAQTGTMRINTDSIYFGTRSYSGALGPWYHGNLDDVAIWDRALNGTEISDLYTGTSTNTFMKRQHTALLEQQQSNKSFVTLSPNPSDKLITLSGKNLTGLSYTIINSLGEVQKTGVLNDNGQVAVEELSSGVYFIRLSKTDIAPLKFVKL